MNDEEPKKQPPFQLNQDLSALSVDELHTIADQLRAEIKRLEDTAAAKAADLSAAAALFRK